MTRERLIQLLNQCSLNRNAEEAHLEADQWLLEYINDTEVSKAFAKVPKWYS
jgi:hypothetical protein